VSWSCPQCRTGYGTEDFDLRFFDIDLGGFEVILGVEFLRTLGPILWDFDDLCMTFDRGGWRLLWRGLDSARHDIAEPVTRHDHRIHLLPGSAPVAVRPYHYPQLQKDELERQCAAMLA